MAGGRRAETAAKGAGGPLPTRSGLTGCGGAGEAGDSALQARRLAARRTKKIAARSAQAIKAATRARPEFPTTLFQSRRMVPPAIQCRAQAGSPARSVRSTPPRPPSTQPLEMVNLRVCLTRPCSRPPMPCVVMQPPERPECHKRHDEPPGTYPVTRRFSYYTHSRR